VTTPPGSPTSTGGAGAGGTGTGPGIGGTGTGGGPVGGGSRGGNDPFAEPASGSGDPDQNSTVGKFGPAGPGILPGGTAYQTDLGMTGPVWSVIGFDPKTVLPRFINALPTRFEVGDGPVVFNATVIDIDKATGRALAIERIQQLVEV
jgi:hypothetical protein